MSDRRVLVRLAISLASALVLALTAVACSSGAAQPAPPSDGRPVIAVQVGASGYDPAEVTAAAGSPVRLVFTRTTDEGCGQQLVFPELDIRRDLPLNEPVAIDLTMPPAGRFRFTCGMDMYDGTLVAQ